MGRLLSFLSRKRVGLFFVVLLGLNGAGWILVGRKLVRAAETAPNALRIEAVLPTQDLERADRLVIVFANPVIGEAAPGEELPALQAAPFTLEPELAGTWHWESTERLAFLPAAPLGPCRRLRMLPTAELERLAGRPVAAGMEAVYETTALQLLSARNAATDGRTVVVELEFNAEVEAAALEEALAVLGRGGEPLDWRRITHGALRTHRLQVDRPASDALFIDLAAGLMPAHAELAMDGPERARVDVPRHFAIIGNGAEIHRTRAGGTIKIQFSTPLATGQESLPVRVTPAVADMTCRASGRRLVIDGRFEPRTAYIVHVAGSVLSAEDEVLGEDARIEVLTPRRWPSLKVSHGDGILSPTGHLSLSVLAGGVRTVRVTAHKVSPGNVVQHVRGNSTRHTSRQILSELYPLPVAEPGADPVQLHALDLAALFTQGGVTPNGIYELEVADTDSRWTSDDATVRITDLAPTAKRDSEGVHVWVRRLSSGESLAQARVSVMTITDQVLGFGATDEAGYVFIETPASHPDGEPYLALVEFGEGDAADLAYLSLYGQRWSVPRDVARGRATPEIADVFLYPERNLYRPGDTVHLTAIARSTDGLVYHRPLRYIVLRPDGVAAHEETLLGDPAQGVAQFEFPTSPDARTGVWSVRALDVETETVVGRTTFSLEAFLPARLDLQASAELPDGAVRASRALQAHSQMSVRSLSGTSVEGFVAKLLVRWSPRDPVFASYPLFNFEAANDSRSVVRAEGEVTLGPDGIADVELPGQEALETGAWEARVEWTVTEPGSRSSVAVTRAELDTASVHLGLRVDRAKGLDLMAEERGDAGASAVATGSPFQVLGLALDPGGVPLTGRALWFALERVESHYELQRSGNRTEWRRKETAHAVWSAAGERVGEHVLATVLCPTEGRYRLTLFMEPDGDDSAPGVSTTFYATDNDPTRFEVPGDDAELVVLAASAKRADPGGSLTVQVRAPLDGIALVTLEDAQLRWHTQVPVIDGRAEVEIPIPADVRGGVTVTCQVTRPLDATHATWMPHRAYGFLHIDTAHVRSHLAVEIAAPERVRPGDEVDILVQADVATEASEQPSRGGVVHLWAVDEGIRLAGGHRLPKPREHFLGRRAYAGRSTDAWFDLIPDLDLAGAVSRIGGDASGVVAARRRAPEQVHSLPGVVWLEAVPLDDEGRAQFHITTPEFTGELTWMAVVVDGDRYGSTQAKTRLAGEVPMLVSQPRFVAPGDRFEVQLRFENQTDESVTLVPRLELTGPVRERVEPLGSGTAIEASASGATSLDSDAVTLAPGETGAKLFELEATGTGRILGMALLEGQFEGGRAARETAQVDLPVRNGRPLVIASVTRCLDAAQGGVQELDLVELLGLESGAELSNGQVLTSAHFSIGLLSAGSYLSSYPYGCAEQTSSRTWALLALPELLPAGDDPDQAAREVQRRVAAGIARLQMMQTSSGGIAYWPSGSEPSSWASIYVAELLHDARELDHSVPASMVEQLVDYLREQLESSGSSLERAALVHGIVSLGQPMPGWVRRLAEQAGDIGPGGRALIAGALAMEGERERALELILDERLLPEESPRTSFTHLSSPTRTAALQLRVLLDVAPDHERVLELVAALEKSRQAGRGRWSNTVDNAAALVALAEFHHALTKVPADWSMNLSTGAGRTLEANSQAPSNFALAATETQLRLELSGEGSLFLTARFEGRVGQTAVARDAGLRVRRRWVDRKGEPVDMQSVAVGALVFVEVSLLSQAGARVDDVAIVDPLPGGFEVENPRLSDVSFELDDESRKAGRVGQADRVEFLDDRVVIFASATDDVQVFRYALRAVAPGDFEHGPIQAEAMYEPEICSVGSGTTRVQVLR